VIAYFHIDALMTVLPYLLFFCGLVLVNETVDKSVDKKQK